MEKVRIGHIQLREGIDGSKCRHSLENYYWDNAAQRMVYYADNDYKHCTKEEWIKRQSDKHSVLPEVKFIGYMASPQIEVFGPEGEGSDAKKRHDSYMKFLRSHPKVYCEGNPNAQANAPFVLVIDADLVKADITDFELRYNTYALLKELSEESLSDAAYFFGVFPDGKTRDEILHEMYAPDKGVLSDLKQAAIFIKLFGDAGKNADTKESNDKDARILANWAQKKGEITTDGEGRFHYGSTLLGTTIAEVVTYLMLNKPVYEVLEQKRKSQEGPVAKTKK